MMVEAMVEAKDLGKKYEQWDEEQLIQSTEYANNILPKLRQLAGYEDVSGAGTYTHVGDDSDEDILESDLEILEEMFWSGVYTE